MLTEAARSGLLVTEEVEWGAALRRVCTDPAAIRVVGQPIVDLARGEVAGYELLARFDGPPEASPDKWFAAAARLGTAEELEAAVLARMLAARAELPVNCFASLNVSPHTLLTEPVRRVFDAAGSLEATVVEVTEQSAVDDYATLAAYLDVLRGRGAMVAIDDTGAGYASLSHVTTLRPDFVKIDRGLVCDCDTDEAKLAALEMLGVLAGRIDAWVIAEGLERPEELEALMALRVPLAQGYFLGRPSVGFGDVEPRAAEVLSAVRSEQAVEAPVAVLLERAPSVPFRDEPRLVAAALLTNPRAEVIVAVDQIGRPVGFVCRSDPARLRRPMTIAVTEGPHDLARRAMTRPPETRFDPLVCCDERGRYRGILTVDRLVMALTA